MELIEKIKYTRDDNKNDSKLKILISTAVFSLLILIYAWSFLVAVAILLILVAEFFFFTAPDGEINIYSEDGNYFLEDFHKTNKNPGLEKISCAEFSWNYYHISSGTRDSSGPRGSHINFIQLKLEIELKTNNKIVLLKELNQWESPPENWEYKPFDPGKYPVPLLTSVNLMKLKTRFEEQSI